MKKLILIPLIFLFSLAIVTAQLLSIDDTVASYRFEDGSGTICTDSGPNNLTGSLNGTTLFIGSKGNNGTGDFATRYDGVDDFCQVPNPDLNLTIPFSISLWVNKTDAISDEVFLYKNIVGTDTNFGIKLDASEQVTVFHRVDGETTRAVIALQSLTIGEWVHIVAIVNGTASTDAFLYFDGTQIATTGGSSIGVDASDLDLYIGIEANLDGDFLGDLDEINFFNFSLSQTQITDLFNNGLGGFLLNETNLNVFQSKNPVEILESFTLFANYTNTTDNAPIPNATCFANSSVVGGGSAGFGRGVLGIGSLSTIGNAVHTQVNDIFGNNILRVDIDGLPLGKASYGVSFRTHAHNQTPTDNLRILATCHPNNLTLSNFTQIGQVNFTEAVISTSTGNDTIWGFSNVVLFGASVASPNCSVIFESINTTVDKHWMIADTISTLNLNNSFTSTDFGETYVLRTNADTRSPFVDAGFGLDVPSETTMTFNATTGLYFLPNVRHGRPFDFEDRVFCSANNFENATDFVVTNVQDNVNPIVQINSISPAVIIINITTVTIQWNVNDPELQTNFINVSFPNGTLIIQTEDKPLVLTPSSLTVIGNYTVTAFANDTGGLSTTANATFEVQELDVTVPVITLVIPANNTATNIIPLNITFTVTDNSPNNIFCTLTNSTTIFDTGTFTQATNSNLTLAEGEIVLDQAFPNLLLQCFDNTFLNNSATLNLNYTLDTNPPIIFDTSPINLSIFNREVTPSVSIKGSCSDVPVFKFNVTVSNSTDLITTFEDTTPVNNQLDIDGNLDISNLIGNITLLYSCFDTHTRNKIADYTTRKNSSPESNRIRYQTKDNLFDIVYKADRYNIKTYSTTKSLDNDRYNFNFKINETEGSKRTFTFNVINRKGKEIFYFPNSKYPAHFVTGTNFIDFQLNDESVTYRVTKISSTNWEVEIETTKTNLNFNSIGELNEANLLLQFEVISIPQISDLFDIRVCRTDVGSVLLLALFILISFGLIGMGLMTKIGFIGLFGSLMLLFSALFIIPCALTIATLLIFVSILFFFQAIISGFFPRTSGER